MPPTPTDSTARLGIHRDIVEDVLHEKPCPEILPGIPDSMEDGATSDGWEKIQQGELDEDRPPTLPAKDKLGPNVLIPMIPPMAMAMAMNMNMGSTNADPLYIDYSPLGAFPSRQVPTTEQRRESIPSPYVDDYEDMYYNSPPSHDTNLTTAAAANDANVNKDIKNNNGDDNGFGSMASRQDGEFVINPGASSTNPPTSSDPAREQADGVKEEGVKQAGEEARVKGEEAEIVRREAEDERVQMEKERVRMQEERVRLGRERVRIEEERGRMENERVRMEEERVRMENERVRMENERVRIERERARLERERARLEKERVRLEEEEERERVRKEADEEKKASEKAERKKKEDQDAALRKQKQAEEKKRKDEAEKRRKDDEEQKNRKTEEAKQKEKEDREARDSAEKQRQENATKQKEKEREKAEAEAQEKLVCGEKDQSPETQQQGPSLTTNGPNIITSPLADAVEEESVLSKATVNPPREALKERLERMMILRAQTIELEKRLDELKAGGSNEQCPEVKAIETSLREFRKRAESQYAAGIELAQHLGDEADVISLEGLTPEMAGEKLEEKLEELLTPTSSSISLTLIYAKKSTKKQKPVIRALLTTYNLACYISQNKKFKVSIEVSKERFAEWLITYGDLVAKRKAGEVFGDMLEVLS